MAQPIPKVSPADVKRVIQRDFPAEQFDAVMTLLTEVTDEVPRIQLAVLKLADGNLERVAFYVNEAKWDWREVLGKAEYPKARNKWGSRRWDTDDSCREAVYAEDWQQHQAWLNRS
jgi:hypothetical protein